MPQILALQGAGSTGKSQTLQLVIQQLQTKYPLATLTIIANGRKDRCVLLGNVKGKIVGVETQGDPNSRLAKSLKKLTRANCDVIFCACRTSGMTVKWIQAYSATHAVRFVPKALASAAHGKVNAAQAAALIQLAGL